MLRVVNALFAAFAFVWCTKHLKDKWWNCQHGEPQGNKSEWNSEQEKRREREGAGLAEECSLIEHLWGAE